MESVSNPALVLIADRSEEFFNDLQCALATTDYTFVYAKNGKEAIALRDLLKSEIEFAVVDLELASPGGVDLIERFAQQGLKPRRIIATTVFPEPFPGEAKFLGVDAVVRKPMTPNAWLHLLNELHPCPEPPAALSPSPMPFPLPQAPSLPGPASRFMVAALAMLWIALVLFSVGGLTANRTTAMAAQAKPSIVLFRGEQPLRQTHLEYPVEARKGNVSGVVEMQITIAPDGSVRSPRVLSGNPLLLTGLATEVSKWLYRPFRINGEPVQMVTELGISFNLPSGGRRFETPN